MTHTFMMRVFTALFATLAAQPIGAEQPSKRQLSLFLDPAIPHVVAGGPQWQTTFIFHNPSDKAEKFYLSFYGDDGKPIQMPLLGNLYPSLLVTLPPHATVKAVTDYRPDIPERWGSALATDPYSCADCNFSYSTIHTVFAMYDWQAKKFLCEATVPQESSFENNVLLIYDQEVSSMGVALMNPSTYEIKKVAVSIYDKDDKALQQDEFYMDPLTHRAFVLADKYPVTRGRIGYVKFSTTGLGGVAGIGLRFSPSGTFTSMHFVSGR